MPDRPNPPHPGLPGYKFAQALLIGYWLALVIATHVPSDFPGVPGDHWDKVVHGGAYALLAALFATTWQLASGELMFRHLRAAWLVLIFYGALDEWTQSLVGRDANLFEWLADVAGAAMGLAVFVWVKRRYAK
ncbi:MAG: VanZ family protein [Pirellulales bacterium]